MHRLTRGLTRLIPNSSESNSPIILYSSLYSNKTQFHRSNPIKFDKLNPLAAAFPILHLTYTQQNPSSHCRNRTAMDSASASGGANDDFVHVEDDVVRSDSSHSDDSESVVDEGVVNNDNDDGGGVGGGGIGASVYERKELPEELAQRVMMLTCESTAEGGVCDVYLVGSAHVSAESCQEVQAVISFLKPQVVFLELCSSRVAVLTPQDLKVPTMGEMVEMWKKNKQNPFGIIYSWFLAKVGSKLEVMPGAEFRMGFDEAMKYGGRVILGDRPVQITLRRTWARLPLWHKTKLITSLVFQAISLPDPETLSRMLKEMDDVDMLTLIIQEMSKQYPTLMETLVHERDKYMSSTLLRVASEHNSVVAVVGKGHLAGIRKHWKEPIEIMDLLEMPVSKPGVPVKKILKFLGVAVAGVAITAGIYNSSKK